MNNRITAINLYVSFKQTNRQERKEDQAHRYCNNHQNQQFGLTSYILLSI